MTHHCGIPASSRRTLPLPLSPLLGSDGLEGRAVLLPPLLHQRHHRVQLLLRLGRHRSQRLRPAAALPSGNLFCCLLELLKN